MKKEFHLTKEGVAELRTELSELKKQRKEVADKLKTAREFGDLAENAEYHAARDEQVKVETRVAEIEHILKNVEIIKQPKKHDKVQLGATVELAGESGAREYTIVGSVEANPAQNKISDESPIGKAMLGKKVGDEVVIKLPAGAFTYTVKKIC